MYPSIQEEFFPRINQAEIIEAAHQGALMKSTKKSLSGEMVWVIKLCVDIHVKETANAAYVLLWIIQLEAL